jgi:uncharacterized protein DUF29
VHEEDGSGILPATDEATRMPNRSAGEADLVPAEEGVGPTYEHDFYAWTFDQARLIREGRWTAIDRENVAEEIESLGKEQFSKLRSAIRVLLLHMLKWDHRPDRRSRSWSLSIRAQRIDLEDVLEGNPGLRPRIGEAIEKAYRKARIEAAQETGLEEEKFPQQCPYAWSDIVGRDFSL